MDEKKISNVLTLTKNRELYPSNKLREALGLSMKSAKIDFITQIVGKKPKVINMIINIFIIILLALFLTGFGYQPWWLFVIVLVIGLFITLPACFNPYWLIDKKNIEIISYSNNDFKKFGQLLNLNKKDQRIINFDDIDQAEINYRKTVRISPFDFNPDHLFLVLTLKNKEIMELDLANIDYDQLMRIIDLLNNNEIDVYDRQQIVLLMSENENLFKHFHKKWATL